MIRIDCYQVAQTELAVSNEARKDQVAQHKAHIRQLRNQRLSQLLNQDITDQDIIKTEYGKPYIADTALAFNHTHSAQHYILVSSQQQQDLGVDVEDLQRKVKFDALAQHAFHPDEYRMWCEADRDTTLWFRIWTLKEALLKASGLGIRLSLNTLNTGIHPIYDNGICEDTRLGVFAYQSFELQGALVTVAWRTAQHCQGFQIPRFEINYMNEPLSI